jgi:hypothetical protein
VVAGVVRRVAGEPGRAAAPGAGESGPGKWRAGQAISAGVPGGGLMVMVTVQPGCSFCSRRSR